MFNWPYKHSHTKLLRLTSSLRQHSFIMFSSRADITISFGLCPPPPTPSPPSQHNGKKWSNLSDSNIWVPTAPICSTFGYGWNVQQSSQHYKLFGLCPPPPTPSPLLSTLAKKSSNFSDLHIWVSTAPICSTFGYGWNVQQSSRHYNLLSLYSLSYLLPCSLLSTLAKKRPSN